MRKDTAVAIDVETRLQSELERLKDLTGLGEKLRVEWCPADSFNLSGKVERDIIYIYEEDGAKSLDVLRHEFLDYIISLAIKPYERATVYYKVMVNALIKRLGEEAYLEKENIVEALKKWFLELPSS